MWTSTSERSLSTPFDQGHLERIGNPLSDDLARLRHPELPVLGGNGLDAGQNLSSPGERRDPGRLVHLSSAVVLPPARRLRGMHSNADERSEPVGPAMLREGALDGHPAR